MYKVEDLRFYQMPRVFDEGLYRGRGASVFEIENELTLDEKIEFIDAINDGIATYLLNLHAAWAEDEPGLPKHRIGHKVITNSAQAWLRRNDDRSCVSTSSGTSYLGYYRLFGKQYSVFGPVQCNRTPYGQDLVYAGYHLAHQWFHDLCIHLANTEEIYFKRQDPYHTKLRRVLHYTENYGVTFDNEVLLNCKWNPHLVQDASIPEEDLDRYIAAYEKLERAVTEIGDELASEVTK